MKSTVYDTSGNNNGVLNSGEIADITVTFKNMGGVDFTNLSTTIECSDTNITISDNSGYFGYLAMDSIKENTADPYVVSVSSSAPQGHIATFNLIATDAGFVDTFNFKLVINPYDYLIWNPDLTPWPGQIIDSVLTVLGYAGNYSTTFDPNADLNVYMAIFVCVGVGPNKSIILDGSDEANALVNYVINGGRMYLEGGDVWYYDPLYIGGYNFGPLFGIDAVSVGTGDMGPVVGVSGTFTEGMDFAYAGENMYMDHIAATGTGFVIFQDEDNDYDCGVANDAGTYRTVGTSFELGGLVDGSGVSTKAVLLDSIMHFFGVFPTGVEEVTKLDVITPKLELYPNPFSDKINIRYSIAQSAKGTELKIYDATGRLVKDFSLFTLDASRPTPVTWDGKDTSGHKVSSGIYFVTLETEDFRKTKKVILIE